MVRGWGKGDGLALSFAPLQKRLGQSSAAIFFKRVPTTQLSGFYNGLYGMSPHQSQTGVYVFFCINKVNSCFCCFFVSSIVSFPALHLAAVCDLQSLRADSFLFLLLLLLLAGWTFLLVVFIVSRNCVDQYPRMGTAAPGTKLFAILGTHALHFSWTRLHAYRDLDTTLVSAVVMVVLSILVLEIQKR